MVRHDDDDLSGYMIMIPVAFNCIIWEWTEIMYVCSLSLVKKVYNSVISLKIIYEPLQLNLKEKKRKELLKRNRSCSLQFKRQFSETKFTKVKTLLTVRLLNNWEISSLREKNLKKEKKSDFTKKSWAPYVCVVYIFLVVLIQLKKM